MYSETNKTNKFPRTHAHTHTHTGGGGGSVKGRGRHMEETKHWEGTPALTHELQMACISGKCREGGREGVEDQRRPLQTHGGAGTARYEMLF